MNFSVKMMLISSVFLMLICSIGMVNGKPYILTQEVANNVMKNTKIAPWFNPKLSFGTSTVLVANEVVNNETKKQQYE